jgi:uncharacterized linocin/CFP29 family protein
VNHLLRGLAPISDDGWSRLDEEARQRLAPALAARRLVDFTGPRGWEHSATDLGRVGALDTAPAKGVAGLQRRVLPLVEARADFALSRGELMDADRGADDTDLGALDEAAHQIAIAENAAVFNGWAGAFTGIAEATPHERVLLGEPARFPDRIAGAIELLLSSGVAGPYGLALGSDAYTKALETSERGGYPLVKHLREILDGPIAWAPGLQGGVLVSQRGGDFVFESGQDLSIGYASHDEQLVRLYLQESFSFHVATPEAAVALEP